MEESNATEGGMGARGSGGNGAEQLYATGRVAGASLGGREEGERNHTGTYETIAENEIL